MIESYSEKEVCEMWKRAGETERAIKILSELTLLDRKEVKAILKKNGLYEEKNTEKIIEQSKKIKNKNMQICFMRHRGMLFREIGEVLGITDTEAQNRYTKYRSDISTEGKI